MNNKVRFAAYGTLRKGSYNYERFKDYFGDDFEYVETQVSKQKFVMLDNGMYPYLMTSHRGNEPTPIVFDIIECSQEAYNLVEDMELGAGYEVGEVELNGESYKNFLFKHETNYPQITSGDWNQRSVESKKTFA